MMGWKAQEEGDHSRAVPIAQQIQDGPLLDIREDAPRPTPEVDLVDAQPGRRDERARLIQRLGVRAKDARTVLSASRTSSATLTNVRRTASRCT